jgi:hypothetical protein
VKLLNTTKKKIAAGAAAAALVASTGVAAAYWTQGGTGTGSASTGTTVDVTVNQTSTISDLYPGGDAVTLSGDFDNTNDGPVKVGSVTVVVDPTFSEQDDAGKPACTPADFEIGGSAVVDDEIVSGSGVGAWTGLTIKLVNSATNQDNCKNLAAVPLIYSVSAAA